MTSSTWFLFALLASLNLLKDTHLFCSADPTDGFTAMPLSERNFDMQWPYNLNLNDRYSYVDGVRRLWVYSTDKPFKPSTTTKPRTEIRIRIHHTTDAATILMLMFVDGQLKFYHSTLVESNIYGRLKGNGPNTFYFKCGVYAQRDEAQYMESRWVGINVVHDVDTNKIAMFVDGVQKLETDGNGPNAFYFKSAVYGQIDETHYMGSRWRDIRVLKKDS
ncbi:uncharacterized protein A4U43_C09F1760 [Asparagus officinalis]|uniref:Alginate lyase 2 domain-containing protein n=1 Tax=Asparagus officinalis TaxID=4686 RepID=A0A5P1E4J7_ASPOF|nr:uncharacterized protein A4U43_C09F1760 [Asparagus officinalis]